MTPTSGRRWIAATTAILVAVLAGPWVGPAAADGERAGSASVVTPEGEPLDGGGSTTAFALRLPAGAACPGDSAEEDFRIQSFIVPEGVDPGGLVYESTKPAGEGRWALYGVNSDPYVNGLTSMAVTPGAPGTIDGLPAFDFAVFPPGTLAEGVNHIGIACTRFNETIRYWATDLVLTDDPEDEPAQLRWVAVGAAPGSGGSSSRRLGLAVGAGVLTLAGVALLVRRRRPSVEPALEQRG